MIAGRVERGTRRMNIAATALSTDRRTISDPAGASRPNGSGRTPRRVSRWSLAGLSVTRGRNRRPIDPDPVVPDGDSVVVAPRNESAVPAAPGRRWSAAQRRIAGAGAPVLEVPGESAQVTWVAAGGDRHVVPAVAVTADNVGDGAALA